MDRPLSTQIAELQAKLMTSRTQREIIALSLEFGELVNAVIEKENALPSVGQDRAISGTIKFTKREVLDMDKTFKKVFILNGLVAHVIKRERVYEIRYRRNGYNIAVSSADLQTAKNKFLTATRTENIHEYQHNALSHTLKAFTLVYFEKFRKNRVSAETYDKDFRRLNKHIFPALGGKEIKKITPTDCQTLLDGITEQGKGKTAEEVYGLLSIIFKGALAHDIIGKNPLAIVQKPIHERENGTALTKDEETQLLNAPISPIYRTAFALALYCGLRPNEIYTAKIDGPFIVAVNSKRKNGKVEYKKIPITDMLRPYVSNDIPRFPKCDLIREKIKKILPNHKLYDCRTTFYSRCIECGVDERAVKLFMGHSSGKLANAYTDVSDEYLLSEGNKLKY